MEILPLLISLCFGGLTMEGNGPDSLRYADLLGREMGAGLVDTIAARALAWCAERGFPLATARVVRAEGPQDSLVIVMRVETGPLVILRDVLLGDKRASAALKRSLSDLLGFPYSPERTQRALERAESFGFGTMEVSGFKRQTPGFAVVLRKTGGHDLVATGTASYDPDQGQVFGYLDLKALNIAATGRGATLSWERLSLLSQNIEATYREPWVLGGPLWLELGAGYAFAESLYLKTHALYRAIYPLSGETEIWVGQSYLSARDFQKSETERGFFVIAGATWSARRPRLFPQKGFFLSGDSRLSPRFQRLSWKLVLYKGLGPVFVSPGLRGGRVRSGDDLLITDLFPLGGPSPPRGYRPERFWVETHDVLSLEAGVAGPASPFVFADMCDARDIPSWLSWGGGLRLRGENLGLEAVYARASAPREPGLVHISLVGQF